jgi:hypothetical protein
MFPSSLGGLPIMPVIGMSRIMRRPIIPIMPCPDEPWHIEQRGIPVDPGLDRAGVPASL